MAGVGLPPDLHQFAEFLADMVAGFTGNTLGVTETKNDSSDALALINNTQHTDKTLSTHTPGQHPDQHWDGRRESLGSWFTEFETTLLYVDAGGSRLLRTSSVSILVMAQASTRARDASESLDCVTCLSLALCASGGQLRRKSFLRML